MRVIVTRPQREAQAWVQAIRQAGHEAMAWPLIDIRAAADDAAVAHAWKNLDAYAIVMFVSSNAVDYFFDSARDANRNAAAFQRPAQLRAWATGPGTTAALMRLGVAADRIDAPDAQSQQFDTEALWDRVAPSVKPGHKVLIVRGSDGHAAHAAQGVGRDWLAAQLSQAGAPVDFVVSYERCLPHWDETQIQEASQAAKDGSLWLFSSSQAIANLQLLLPDQAWQHARALATHARIARAAGQAGFGQVRETRPLLADVLASIESCS
jgi:uroporphyrinogen-III synthase